MIAGETRPEGLMMSVERNKAIVRLDSGDLCHRPASRCVSRKSIILRFVDGKVVEQRGLPDNLAALRQLGVVPTPQATSS
jgi:hypothetical protein